LWQKDHISGTGGRIDVRISRIWTHFQTHRTSSFGLIFNQICCADQVNRGSSLNIQCFIGCKVYYKNLNIKEIEIWNVKCLLFQSTSAGHIATAAWKDGIAEENQSTYQAVAMERSAVNHVSIIIKPPKCDFQVGGTDTSLPFVRVFWAKLKSPLAGYVCNRLGYWSENLDICTPRSADLADQISVWFDSCIGHQGAKQKVPLLLNYNGWIISQRLASNVHMCRLEGPENQLSNYTAWSAVFSV
jgi:hypothetical protein